MKMKDLIRRALAGDPLNALERAELERFDPDAAGNELENVRKKLEAAENAKLSAEELLQKKLDAASRERDEFKSDRDRLHRNIRIREIADRSGCRDAGYLDYLAGRAGIDLDDEEAVRGFVAGMEEENPRCFNAGVHPGGGAGTPGKAPENPSPEPGGDRIGRIIESLDNAPEAR